MKILYVENHAIFSEQVCRQFLSADEAKVVSFEIGSARSKEVPAAKGENSRAAKRGCSGMGPSSEREQAVKARWG